MVIAKQRIAMGYGNIDTKPKRLFNSESDARLYEEEAKNKLEIEKERVKNKLEIEKENAKSRNTIKEQNNAARKAANKPGSDGTAVAVDKDNFPNIYNAQNDLKSSLSNRELLTESKISKKDVQKLVDNVAKNTNIKIPVGSKLYKVDVADLPPAINTKFKGLGADEVIMVENDNGFNIYVTDVADDYKVYSEYDLLRLTTGESKDAKEEWNKIDRAGVSKEPQVEKTNSKKPEWTGEFDSKGKMIFK